MNNTPLRILVRVADQKFQNDLPERPVIHFGSAAGCEIVIPCQTAHAATLIRRGPRCFLLNRTTIAIDCGKTKIKPGRQAEWLPGMNVIIEGVELQWVSPTPAGVVKPPSQALPAERGSQTVATAQMPGQQPMSAQRVRSWCVILVCAVILTMQFKSPGRAEPGTRMQQMMGAWQQRVAAVQQLQRDEAVPPQVRERMGYLHRQLSRLHLAIVSDGRLPSDALQQDVLLFCRSLTAVTDVPEERRVCRDLSSLIAAL